MSRDHDHPTRDKMREVELIGVPYTSAGGGRIDDAIAVLREVGLMEHLAPIGVFDAGDLAVAPGSGMRGASGLLHEDGLERLVDATRTAVGGAMERSRVPLVVGGDCPVLLGALAAGRDRLEGPGLLFLDGHEDAWPPELSPTGEASDSEVAIALGHVDQLPATLGAGVPSLRPQQIAMVGPRDRHEISDAGLASLRDLVGYFCDDAEVRALGAPTVARTALDVLAGNTSPFWLHIDLDVLRTHDFAAVDYRQPGGLTWDELETITSSALAAAGCFGCSVVIYNPALDPERACADRLVRFLADVAARGLGSHPS